MVLLGPSQKSYRLESEHGHTVGIAFGSPDSLDLVRGSPGARPRDIRIEGFDVLELLQNRHKFAILIRLGLILILLGIRLLGRCRLSASEMLSISANMPTDDLRSFFACMMVCSCMPSATHCRDWIFEVAE